MALPPLPPGASLINDDEAAAIPRLDPAEVLKREGFIWTNGFRTEEDTARIRRQGYKPARNSAHLRGDGLDVDHPTLSPSQQKAKLESLFGDWEGARVLDEGHHRHLQLPGWGGAPGTPGSKWSGLPKLPKGAELVQRGALTGNERPSDDRMAPYLERMAAADAKAAAADVPEDVIREMQIRAIQHPDNFAPAPDGLFTEPPMTQEEAAANIARLRGESVPVPSDTAPEERSRIGVGPAIQAIKKGIVGEAPIELVDNRQTIGGFADELPEGPRRKLTPEQEAQFFELAKDPNSTADQLRALVSSYGMDLNNADEIVSAREKAGQVSGSIHYKLPEAPPNPDGATGAALRGFADPVNFLDEAGAVFDSIGIGGSGEERPNIWNSDRAFGDILDENIDRNRGILQADERDHPYARLGGQLASGILLPYGGGVRSAAGLAKLGAAEGAVAGLGAGEGNIVDRLPDAAIGAGLGTVAAPVIGKTIEGVVWIGGRLVRRVRGEGGEIIEIPVANADEAAASPEGGFDTDAYSRAAADIEASAPPVPSGHVRLWKATNGRNFTTDLAGTALPIRNGRGGDLGYIDIPEDDAALYAVNGTEYRLPTAIAGQSQSIRFADDSAWGARSAAMEMEDEAPELVERQRDYINLPPLPEGATLVDNPMDRGLGGAGPTDEAMAAFGRADPESVLPRSSNRIESEEEFVAANPTTFRDVFAPSPERVLEMRNIPDPRRPGKTIRWRGPLDAEGFLRLHGGLVDQSGELRHMGIVSNAPRRDFKQEAKLGRILDNERGMTFDEAGELLWEAGYVRERPTVSEVLDILHASRNGKPLYHPDDLEGVARFEDANLLHWSSRKAEDEGAPLSERIGESVTYDDLVKNAPPVVAYEELPKFGKYIGNLNIEHIEGTDDIRRALHATQEAASGFETARRGVVSHVETAALARDLGMTVDDLLKRRQGQAFNAHQALAARQMLAKSADNVVDLARRASGGSDADKVLFRQAWTRHVAIQEQVSAMTAEAGRTLNQFRMLARSRDSKADVMRAVIDDNWGGKTIDEIASGILDNADDPGRLNAFMRAAFNPKWRDKLVELSYFMKLSGVRTHAVNILSNSLTSILQIPEFAATAGVGKVRQGFNKAFGRETHDRVMASEVGARAHAMLDGVLVGAKAARQAFKTGEPSDSFSKIETRQMEANTGLVGKVVRFPMRLLTVEDEFFKGMARTQDIAGQAHRQAISEGLRGKRLEERVAELKANPTDKMIEHAMDYARYQTFQRPLGEKGRAFEALVRKAPVLKAIVVPFVRTPANIFKYALERSPGAVLTQDFRAAWKKGGIERDQVIARMMLGSGFGLFIGLQAAQGNITGGGPADDNAKRLMRANGWQPYSVKVGDKYISYQRLDPLAMTMGVAADMVDLQTAMTDKQRENIGALVGISVAQNLGNKTFISGITDLTDAYSDPTRYLKSYVNNLVAGNTVPTIAAHSAQAIDPTLRRARTMLDAIKARVPGQSQGLYPVRDVFGRPIKREGGPVAVFASPLPMQTGKNDPVIQAVLDSGARIGMLRQEGRSDADFDLYQEVAGKYFYDDVAAEVSAPDWNTLPVEERRDIIEDLKNRARKDARADLFGDEN